MHVQYEAVNTNSISCGCAYGPITYLLCRKPCQLSRALNSTASQRIPQHLCGGSNAHLNIVYICVESEDRHLVCLSLRIHEKHDFMVSMYCFISLYTVACVRLPVYWKRGTSRCTSRSYIALHTLDTPPYYHTNFSQRTRNNIPAQFMGNHAKEGSKLHSCLIKRR